MERQFRRSTGSSACPGRRSIGYWVNLGRDNRSRYRERHGHSRAKSTVIAFAESTTKVNRRVHGAQKTSQQTNVSITVLRMTAISQVAASFATLKLPQPNHAFKVRLAVVSHRNPARGSNNVPQNALAVFITTDAISALTGRHCANRQSAAASITILTAIHHHAARRPANNSAGQTTSASIGDISVRFSKKAGLEIAAIVTLRVAS